MKNLALYCLLFALLLISCNKGVYITIDKKKYNYGKNTVVRLLRQEGTPIGYGLDIKTFKKSAGDSSFFLIAAGKANIPVTAGDYSVPNNDRTNFPASHVAFYDNHGNRYESGGGILDSTIFFITSLTKKRAKGWFRAMVEDIKADTTKPENTIYVEGRFNVSLKNAKHY